MDFFNMWGSTIVVMLILGGIGYFYYYKRFLKEITMDPFEENDRPSTVASLGVLGTFVGVTYSLWSFNSTNIETSVPALLDGMKTAFITSVAGMISSLLMKIKQKNLQMNFLTDGKNNIYDVDEEAKISDLILYLKEQEIKATEFNKQLLQSIDVMGKSISGESDTTLLSQLKNLRIAIIDEEKNTRDEIKGMRQEMVQSFNEFAKQMAENNSKAFIKALEETIQNFNTKIQEQFGENFKQLNIAVGKLLTWQEEYKNTVVEVTENQKVIFTGIEQAKESLNDMANNSVEIQKSAELLSDIILTAKKYQAELEISLTTLVEISNQAKSVVPEIKNMFESSNESILSSTNLVQDKITELYDSTQDKLIERTNYVQNEVINNTQRIVDLSSKTIEELNKKIVPEINATTKLAINSITEVTNNTDERLMNNAQKIVETSVSMMEHIDKEAKKTILAVDTLSKNIMHSIEINNNSLSTSFNNANKVMQTAVNNLENNCLTMNNYCSNTIKISLEKMVKDIEDLHEITIEATDKQLNSMIDRLNKLSNQMIKLINDQEGELNSAFKDTNNTINQVVNSTSKAIQASTDKLSRSALEVTNTVSDRLVKMNEENNEVLKTYNENVTRVFNDNLKSLSEQLVSISHTFAKDYIPLARKLEEVVNISKKIKMNNNW